MKNEGVTSRACPFCGTETLVQTGGLRPGSLDPEEIETLVRNEWRRRTESRALSGARHPRTLVCALVRYALDPFDPVATKEVENRLWEEVARMEMLDFDEGAKAGVLGALAEALWEVLMSSDLGFEPRLTLSQRIEDKLREVLSWP